MLYFKQQKTLVQQNNYLVKEMYFKLYKLFLIFFKENKKKLSSLILKNKKWIYYRNICIISKKNKSINRVTKVSRIIIREKANIGFFFGLFKLSW